MRFAHVVFDIDGTLIDTERGLMLALAEVLWALQGKRYQPEDLRFTFGLASCESLRVLGVEDVQAASLMWSRCFAKYLHEVKPFDGVVEMLGALRAGGARLGVVTSKSRREYESEFLPTPLGRFFDIAVTADDTDDHKPEPGPMLAYLRKAGARLDEVLYVGDREYDMRCARGAGVQAALAVWGNRDAQRVEADFYPRTPAALAGWLLGAIPEYTATL